MYIASKTNRLTEVTEGTWAHKIDDRHVQNTLHRKRWIDVKSLIDSLRIALRIET